MGLFMDFWRAVTGNGSEDQNKLPTEADPEEDRDLHRRNIQPQEAYPSHAGRSDAVSTEVIDIILNDDNKVALENATRTKGQGSSSGS